MRAMYNEIAKEIEGHFLDTKDSNVTKRGLEITVVDCALNVEEIEDVLKRKVIIDEYLTLVEIEIKDCGEDGIVIAVYESTYEKDVEPVLQRAIYELN